MKVLRILVPFLAAVAVSSPLMPSPAHAAEAKSAEQLINQLECKSGQDCAAPAAAPEPPANADTSGAPPVSRKRGVSQSPPGTKRSFRFETTSEAGRQEVEKRVDAGKLPSTDLEIYFDFNSAEITPQARAALEPLGKALGHPRLAAYRFVLVGHTDGKGGAEFNQRLSDRRAAAVRDHLVQQFQIAPDRLDTYGRGKTALKNPQQPDAGENRRVQVINQGQTAAAETGK